MGPSTFISSMPSWFKCNGQVKCLSLPRSRRPVLPRSLLFFTAPGSCSTSAAPQSVVFLIWRLTLVWSSKELSPWYHPTHLSIFVPTFVPVLLCLSWKSPWWWNTKRVDTQPLHLLSAFWSIGIPIPPPALTHPVLEPKRFRSLMGRGYPRARHQALMLRHADKRQGWQEVALKKLVREAGLKWSLCWPLPGTCLPSTNRWGEAPPWGLLSIGVEEVWNRR